MKIDEANAQKAFSKLEKVYSEIPRTKGCEKANKKGGCKGYCCDLQAPSMFNAEFIYLWRDYVENHSVEEMREIVYKAVRCYLHNNVTKGCVFFDKSNCKCLVHKKRPLICRFYSIIHPANWKSRVKWVKNLYKDYPKKDTRDMWRTFEQCNLVRTIDDKKHINPKDEERWFEETKEAERELGIPDHVINQHDSPEGSYRTMHDFVMMSVFDAKFLNMLSEERENRPSDDDIEKFIGVMKEQLTKVQN